MDAKTMPETTLLHFAIPDEAEPLRLEEVGFNRCHWSSKGIDLHELIAPAGSEIVIRKTGREIVVVRRELQPK